MFSNKFNSRFSAIILVSFLAAQSVFSQQLSPRITTYRIKATLNAQTKTVDGNMLLTWKNPSNDTVGTLQFHLYLNAFKNTESTFFKESGGQLRGMQIDRSKAINWGRIDILKMTTGQNEDLTHRISFIHPDDDNVNDRTVIEVPLDKPVLPGETISLNIEFRSKLPKVFARTGFNNNFFLVAQWFPKLGVYEPAGMRYATKGGWNCHQFHANSEFYANFSTYDVDITVPEDFIVGAVGTLEDKTENGNGTITLKYVANDVVDFAWTASPLYKVVEDKWNNVRIMVYLQPEHAYLADRHIRSVKAALDFFDKHLGKYPYHTITIVDPPIKASGAGGMEYPTFITAGSFWGMPEQIRLIEDVTIHEFGHNYFMGILATNEFEEAWMDEGFNTWFEGRIMDHTYGKKTSFVDFRDFHLGDGEMQRIGYTGMDNPKIAEVFRYSWQYPNGAYGLMSYNKTATWLMTLEGLVGQETMDEIMKTYYDRWKFKHPCANDFIDIVNETVTKNHGDKFGKDMNWFFDEVLYGSDVCDYKLASIKNIRVRKPGGITDDLTDLSDTTSQGEKLYRSKVILYRMGEVIMPVEVLVHFDNGDEVLETWDGKSRTKEFSYERPEKIEWAKIDPEEKIKIDVDLTNNGKTLEPVTSVAIKYMLNFMFIVQNMLQTLIFFA